MGKNKLNVLIIEDDTVIGMYIKKIVTDIGCEVIDIVSNADMAYHCAKHNRVDLLIADIRIKSETDGIDVAKILQKQYNMPVIFLTAFHDNPTLKRASEVDSIGYLIKPIRKNELEVLLQLCINKQPSSDMFDKLNSDYIYDHNKQILFHNGREINLTEKEKNLLLLLIRSQGSVVSYYNIDEILWHDNAVSDAARRQLLYRLKSKLPNLDIEVIKKIGYRLK